MAKQKPNDTSLLILEKYKKGKMCATDAKLAVLDLYYDQLINEALETGKTGDKELLIMNYINAREAISKESNAFNETQNRRMRVVCECLMHVFSLSKALFSGFFAQNKAKKASFLSKITGFDAQYVQNYLSKRVTLHRC